MATEKRLIDANDADPRNLAYPVFPGCRPYNQYEQGFNDAVIACYWLLTNAPTVDAVEVCRCKDCQHWHEGTGWCDQHSHFDEDEWNMFDKDDFCSYGERREGE